jgi:hypothetical protein
MTRFIERPQDLRESRLCAPQRTASPMFQGWGPKL